MAAEIPPGIELLPDGGLYARSEMVAGVKELRGRVADAVEEVTRVWREKGYIGAEEALPLDVMGDVRLYRFLAGHGSVDEAEKWIRKHMKWRLEDDIGQYRELSLIHI